MKDAGSSVRLWDFEFRVYGGGGSGGPCVRVFIRWQHMDT